MKEYWKFVAGFLAVVVLAGAGHFVSRFAYADASGALVAAKNLFTQTAALFLGISGFGETFSLVATFPIESREEVSAVSDAAPAGSRWASLESTTVNEKALSGNLWQPQKHISSDGSNSGSGNESGNQISQSPPVAATESFSPSQQPQEENFQSAPLTESPSTSSTPNSPSALTSTSTVPPAPQTSVLAKILISEIMVGVDGNSSYEFIELYNPTSNPVDLTGWAIKKRSSTGSESTLVSSNRLEEKIILPLKYFLLVNEDGYSGLISADVFWPKSYTLAYINNAVIIYNEAGEKIDETSWVEIGKGQSWERASFESSEFQIQNSPNPQNSQ